MSEKQYEGGQADVRMVLENDECPSVFRPKYRKLSDEELALMNNVKAVASRLYDVMDVAYQAKFDDTAPICREHDIARIKLEESIMWAVKGLTS